MIDLSANVSVDVHDVETGELVQHQEHHNLVVNTGLNLVRDLLDGDAVAGLTHLAVGTGTASVLSTNTALGNEVFRDALIGRTSNEAQLIASYYLGSTSANGYTLSEVGLFNAASTGTMFARVLLSPTIVKTSGIAVTINWTINLGAS